jgi:hypothetical protein
MSDIEGKVTRAERESVGNDRVSNLMTSKPPPIDFLIRCAPARSHSDLASCTVYPSAFQHAAFAESM